MGGTVWGVAVTAIGFLPGAAYRQAERSLGLFGTVCLLALIAALLVGHVRGRRGWGREQFS